MCSLIFESLPDLHLAMGFVTAVASVRVSASKRYVKILRKTNFKVKTVKIIELIRSNFCTNKEAPQWPWPSKKLQINASRLA